MEGKSIISYAKVRFIENGEKQVVSSDAIIEFKKYPPKHKADFETNKVYTCLYKDEKYPQLTEYAVQIGRLYGEEEMDQFQKRVSFLPLEESIIERYYNEQNSEESVSESEEKILKEKAQKKEIKKKSAKKNKEQQKDFIQKKLDTLMTGETLKISKPSGSSTMPKISSTLTTDSLKVNEISNNDTDDIERNTYMNLQLEIEKKYESIKTKYEALLTKYNEQSENIQSLQIMNMKLQKMLFEMKSDKNDTKKSPTPSKITDNFSPPISPILSPKNSKSNYTMYTSSPDNKKNLNSSDDEDGSIIQSSGHDDENKQKINHMDVREEKKEMDDRFIDFNVNAVHTEAVPTCSNMQETPKSSKLKRRTCEKVDVQDADETEGSGRKKMKPTLKMKDDTNSDWKFIDKFYENDVKMVYIRHELTMPYDEWKHCLKSKTHSMLAKRMLRSFYSPSKLLRRCIKEGKNVRTPNGVNKRKEISPKKTSAVAKVLQYYMEKYEKITSNEIVDKKVARIPHYFSEEINALKKKK